MIRTKNNFVEKLFAMLFQSTSSFILFPFKNSELGCCQETAQTSTRG